METSGRVLRLSRPSDSIEFIETAAGTGGERCTMKWTLATKGPLVQEHVHMVQEETFEVLSGTLTVVVNGIPQTLQVGQSMVLPKNMAHNHYNEADEPAVFLQTVSPALDCEYMIETLVGLAHDGQLEDGRPGLLQSLVSMKYLESKVFLAGIPVIIQKLLMHVVGPVGRLMGYRAIYAKYSGFEK